MPQAPERSKAILQSALGGLVSLGRRLAHLAEPSPAPAPAQPCLEHDDPHGPLFDVLKALNSEHREFQTRLIRLKEAPSPSPVRPDRPQGDPLAPLFDALESINDELTGFAERLFRLEDAATRAARSRHTRKAVPHA
ncbi:hypothetical protein ACFYY1_30420 [Streptomyces sp. NPDC001890]|uniref:hypothetical protein n=1 Tax=Streptomyces sp. NPDC001890 TaxID=3364620 RepID=UPI00368AF2B3